MMDALNIKDVSELFCAVPDDLKLVRPLNIPNGKSEQETMRHITGLSRKNAVFETVFRGAGAYRHYVPPVVTSLASRGEFVTAYTPYQAEISQGVLQAIFEFQTMVCELTAMDAANASVYDGATAAAEAALMCRAPKRNKALFSGYTPQSVIDTVRTYIAPPGMEMVIANNTNGVTDAASIEALIDENTACVYVQQPNFFGNIEDAAAIADIAHKYGTKLIMGVNPIAASVLMSAGECGADIAVGEGQPLGLGLAFGGPYLGFMACKKELARKLPGRIVGETTDRRGDRAFVLTLQAREQHIRREKATSNICSNQALCALTASIYMSVMGPSGMEETAKICYNKAHYLMSGLCAMEGFELRFKGASFFHEFVTTCPVEVSGLNAALEKHGILGGLELTGGYKNCILWCATEMNTKDDIDCALNIIRQYVKEEGVK